MANRSDFQSDFPRQLKRMIALQEIAGTIKDSHERGALKRIWREAHMRCRDHVNRRGTMAVGQNISLDESGE